MIKFIFMRLAVEMVHIQERIRRLDDDGWERETPFELIQLGDEGIGEEEIVVDEFAIRATGAIRDAPAEGLERAGQDLADATGVLQADFVGMDMVTEAAGLDDGEEAPANLGFFRAG